MYSTDEWNKWVNTILICFVESDKNLGFSYFSHILVYFNGYSEPFEVKYKFLIEILYIQVDLIL